MSRVLLGLRTETHARPAATQPGAPESEPRPMPSDRQTEQPPVTPGPVQSGHAAPAGQATRTAASDPAAQRVVGGAIEPGPVWQRLWFSVIDRHWTSLALVPVDENVPANHLAEILWTLGRQHGEREVHLVDARGTPLAGVEAVVNRITHLGETARVISVVDALSKDPASLHILRSISAVLLIAQVGRSRLTTAKETAAAIGPQRIIGTVALV